ncbi:luciferase family protein [Streptomyces sp. NPDC093982]|uniref:luciferase domain-containing protein n=1 Tax=Streptomyces sp. NPDC093982 TaxID=3155077 RepID=UPI0034392CFC
MTLAARAFIRLATWPNLVEVEPSCGVGRALGLAHCEIVHFHTDCNVDLHLTASVIRRFEEYLTAAMAIRLVSGSQWVSIQLDVSADVQLLTTLVSLALQGHQTWPGRGDAPRAECNYPKGSVTSARPPLGIAFPGRRHRV